MRILLLSQWFPPEPDFKICNLALGLARRGHEVTVLTGFPNYPGGRLYPGYRQSWRSVENIDGVRVIRVPLVPSHSQSRVGRIANYMSFALTSFAHATLSAFRADAAYVYHPPLTVGLSAVGLRAFRGVPFIYDVQDLWPDTMEATRMVSSRIALSVVGRACRVVYRHATRIVAQSPGFRRTLIERGVDPGKVEVVPNWCDETALSATARANVVLGAADRFHLLFAGNLGPAQGLDVLLSAAQRLQESGIPVDIHMLGDGIDGPALRLSAEKMCLTNVRFHRRVPPDEVVGFLKAADALIVNLRDHSLFSITIPSKTQAYMFVGKPIVLAGRGDVADLVRSAGCGLACEPGDPAALADCIARMASRPRFDRLAMGDAGRSYYARELSMARGIERFEELLLAVAEARRRY